MSTRRGHELLADYYAFTPFLQGPELTACSALRRASGAGRQMLLESLHVRRPRADLLLQERS